MFWNKPVKLCVASTVLGKLKGAGKFVNKTRSQMPGKNR